MRRKCVPTLSLQFHHRESSVYLLKFNTIQCSMLCCFRNASIVYHYKSLWNMKIQFNSTFGSFNKMTSFMTNVKMAVFYISKRYLLTWTWEDGIFWFWWMQLNFNYNYLLHWSVVSCVELVNGNMTIANKGIRVSQTCYNLRQ